MRQLATVTKKKKKKKKTEKEKSTNGFKCPTAIGSG